MNSYKIIKHPTNSLLFHLDIKTISTFIKIRKNKKNVIYLSKKRLYSKRFFKCILVALTSALNRTTIIRITLLIKNNIFKL